MKTVIIAYVIDALAPHQNQMVEHLRTVHGDRFELRLRKIPSDRFGRLRLLAMAAYDALFQRGHVLYFSTFLSAPYTIFARLSGHRRWIYHSQDWVQSSPGLFATLELKAARSAPVVIWNEVNRGAKIKTLSGRKNDVVVVPTYLPRTYNVPERSEEMRRTIAQRSGADPDRMVIVFAGGSYSTWRLSAEVVAAAKTLDRDTVLVFTGPSRLPEDVSAPNILDMGLLPYEDMLSVMASSDIGLLLYDYANAFGHRYQQPGRLTEYLRCGLRLIATPFPDAEALADKTEFCLVSEGYSVPDLAESLLEMVRRSRLETPPVEEIKRYTLANMVYETEAELAIKHIAKEFGLP